MWFRGWPLARSICKKLISHGSSTLNWSSAGNCVLRYNVFWRVKYAERGFCKSWWMYRMCILPRMKSEFYSYWERATFKEFSHWASSKIFYRTPTREISSKPVRIIDYISYFLLDWVTFVQFLFEHSSYRISYWNIIAKMGTITRTKYPNLWT